MRKRDSVDDPAQLELIRTHARAALERADALGRYPTPVQDVMDRARVAVADHDLFDAGLLSRLTRKAGGVLKRALSKVLGVLDAKARLVYIDKALKVVKQTFLKLHETGHAVLPWQRDIYAVIEDCEKTLDPETSEQFDREANQFASEVLFQLDTFTNEVNAEPLDIKVPLKAGKRYGASAYASIRRYVSKHHRACAVLVLERPEFTAGVGLVSRLRRFVPSPSFMSTLGELSWPAEFTPADQVGALIPLGGRRMSAPRALPLRDANGTLHECIAEAFDSGHYVFILLYVAKALTARSIVIP